MMRPHLWIGLALAALCYQSPAHAGGLRTLWEVDLGKVISAGSGLPEVPVLALSFSPDGRRLAVVADVYGTREDPKSRLVIIDAQQPSEGVRQFEIPFGIFGFDAGDQPIDLGWTPSGDTFYAAGRVIHLRSGTSCDLPNRSVFINDDFAMSVRPGRPTGTSVTFYGRNCEERGRWEVPDTWVVYDVSPDRGLISVLSDLSAVQAGEWLIVDPLGRKVLQRWPNGPGGPWKFADSGEAVCRGGAVLESNRASATCRDVDTGKVIRESNATGVAPDAMAAHATRVVESDYRRKKALFDYEYRTVYKGRYAWDFGTGQVLAKWHPESETYPSFSPGKPIIERFPFAISPDGQYVAEGGSGKSRLYKIEP